MEEKNITKKLPTRDKIPLEEPEEINQIENKTTEIVTGFLKNNAYNYTDLKNQIIYCLSFEIELHVFLMYF